MKRRAALVSAILIATIYGVASGSFYNWGWNSWNWQPVKKIQNVFSQGATGGAGTITVTSSTQSASKSIPGQGSTGAQGVLQIVANAIFSITGQGSSGAQGTVTATGGGVNGVVSLTGQGATSGASLPSYNQQIIAIAGLTQGASGGAGTVVAAIGLLNGSATISGYGGAGSQGNLSVTGTNGVSISLSGQGASGSFNSLLLSTTGIVAPSGLGGTGGQGTLVAIAGTNGAASLTGQGGTGSYGTITVSGLVFANKPITGQGGTGSNGTITAASGSGATSASDDFNRADASPLSGNWTTITGTGNLALTSNQVTAASNAISAAYYNAFTPANDQFAQVYNSVITSGSNQHLILRSSTSTADFYELTWKNTNEWEFGKVISGSYSTIGTSHTNSGIVNSSTIGFSAVGTKLTMYVNGVADPYTQTDSSRTSGVAGLEIDSTSTLLDNFYVSNTIPVGVSDNFNRAGNLSLVATGTSSKATSGGNLTSIALPTGWAADDVLILFAASQDNVTHSLSSGWTQLKQESADANLQTSMWWRRAQSGDTAPTLTHTGGNAVFAKIAAFRGAYGAGSNQVTSPFSVSPGTSTATSTSPISTTGITTVYPFEMVIHWIAGESRTTAAPSITSATTITTTVFNVDYAGTTNNAAGGAAFYKATTSIGATGNAGATLSVSGSSITYDGVLFSLRNILMGANWSYPTGATPPFINSNFVNGRSGIYTTAYWSADSIGEKQYAETDASGVGGAAVRVQSDADTCYYIEVTDDGSGVTYQVSIMKVTNGGTPSTLVNITGLSPSTTIRLRASGTTSTLLEALVDGSVVGSYTDNSPIRNGQPGVRIMPSSTTDNWVGGTW
jgi:hypothetical protein